MDNPFLILDERMGRMETILLDLQQLFLKQQADSQEILLSSNECRALFSPAISKSTLYRWTKSGLISKQRIAGKVGYKKSEIEAATKTLKTYAT